MQGTEDKNLAELMRRGQQGDQQAYAELLTLVAGIVKGFVRNRVSDSEAVEEISQEILLSIHQARASFTPGRPFRPWMFAIARYRLTDYFRRWAKTKQKEVDGTAVFETLKANPVEEEGPMSAELAEAVAELPIKQRTAIQLLKYQGLSIREAASELGVSESAMKVTAHRAYEALRQKFGAEHGNP